jgi:polar amino acid transport system substrate-binding protein
MAALAITSVAHADRLDEIKKSGKLVCGIFATNEPFGFQDPATRKIVGYDADICNHLAASLGVQPELKSISLEARIPELNQGRVDILTAVLGYSPARAEQIDFSHEYFASTQKIMVKADSNLKELKDLQGKKISANKASSSELAVRKTLPDAEIVTFPDGTTSFLALQQGKAVGFASAEMVLIKLRDASKDTKYDIIREPIAKEPWGVGVRKGETALLNHVNATLETMEKSGEGQKLFDKWFGPSTIYGMERPFKFGPIPR